MTNFINYTYENKVATIQLDDGKANVISVAMQDQIHLALDQAEKDGGVLLIMGRKGMFSGGFDLGVFQQGDVKAIFEMISGGMKLAERIYRFPRPVVAAITGHAVAMGAFITLAADYRVGSNGGARIVANEVAIGLTVPHFAIELCRQKLTPSAFNRAVNLAEAFSGAAAVDAGFFDVIVDPENIVESAKQKAIELSKLNLAAHTATKERSREKAWKKLSESLQKDMEFWNKRDF